MTSRKFVASAYFVLCVSGVAYAQSPAAQQQKVRADELVKQALDRYNENLRAASQAGVDPAQLPAAAAGVSSVPMTLAAYHLSARALPRRLGLNPQFPWGLW